MAHAMSLLPDDVSRWIELARLLEHTALADELVLARSKAETLLQERLSNTPDDGSVAAALADLMPDPDTSPGWTVLQPAAMTSAAGATLSLLPDGSLLAAGPLSTFETYSVDAVSDLSRITAIRLEVIPDHRFPHRGPGRGAIRGTFRLTAVRLTAFPRASQGIAVQLTRARSDFSDSEFGLKHAKGADPGTMWSIYPHLGQHHQAVFQPDVPIEIGRGQKLRAELDSGTAGDPYNTLGRFRLSITNRQFPLFTPSLERIKTDIARHGLSRLGAAYCLQGDWTKAAAVLNRAVALPRASVADAFLLALARHHLGQHAQARIDCDRALERLKTDIPDEETRDVAIEAVMATRNLSVVGAESLLLDAAFPVDPFSR